MIHPDEDFWAITSYFNLTGGARRLRNYRCFKRHLSVPLLTVEWHPQGSFQLRNDDADTLVRISGGDLMWQKERLLNLAVAALPSHVKYVAWLDCDILFENRNWMNEARELLATNIVIQLFSEVAYPDETQTLRLVDLPQPSLEGAGFVQMPQKKSFLNAYGMVGKDIVRYDLGNRFQPDPVHSAYTINLPARGRAWAAQSGFIRDVGFYDRGIAGGGDTHFCYAITGLGPQFIDIHKALGLGFYADNASYRDWSARAAAACEERSGCAAGRILHLFHGSLANRQYRSRQNGLIPFALDLDRDIGAKDGEPWFWRRDRDQFNAYFLRYMRGRKEDGEVAKPSGGAADSG
jgi:hypothetical protein